MKKIKSRFFKFFANQYMIKFANHINKQNIYRLKSHIFFKKIHNYFLVYATIKKHYDWKFLEKTIFELFYDHSDMKENLEELIQLYKNDPTTFNKLTEGLDIVTKFVILEPFKKVYINFIHDNDLLNSFLEKVKVDLLKRNSLIKPSNINLYYDVFKSNIFQFVDYYSENK